MRLDGKIALVTGGNRGLGAWGWPWLWPTPGLMWPWPPAASINWKARPNLVREIGRQAHIIPTDVGQVAEVQAMVQQTMADHYGRLDILVNGAGTMIRQPAHTFTEADWDKLMAINLKGAFFASQAAAEVMRQQEGPPWWGKSSTSALSPSRLSSPTSLSTPSAKAGCGR